jgi:WXXGXW repeat (2 copies)
MASHRAMIKTFLMGAVLALPVAMISMTPARAQVILSVGFAPPALPVYAQPICPGDGYIWTPGYWAYGPDGYFWVPGTWVLPPQVGFLWTPGYWGWGGSAFIFHTGYWGPHIGFYGGINYGFGYGGIGYEGGYWHNGGFFYNRSVNNIGVVHNVYEHPVEMHNADFNHVSFNGGNGGVPARASSQELQAAHEQHIQPTGEQMQHQNFASQNRAQLASVNHGHPGVAAAATPAAFRSNPGNPGAARGGFGGAHAANTARPGGTANASHARLPAPAREATQSRAQSQPRTESRPAAAPRAAESRPAAAPRAASHPAAHAGGGKHR